MSLNIGVLRHAQDNEMPYSRCQRSGIDSLAGIPRRIHVLPVRLYLDPLLPTVTLTQCK